MAPCAMGFHAVLTQLVERAAPDAVAAIFCDGDGERVDAFVSPSHDTYDVDLIGAACAQVGARLAGGMRVRVRCTDRVLTLAPVEAGYYLVVVGVRAPHLLDLVGRRFHGAGFF